MSDALPPVTPPDCLTEPQLALLRKLAAKVVERRLSAPAILFLESYRPMNFVGSQVMLVLKPVIDIFFTLPEWDELRKIMERRESIGLFLDMIDDEESRYLLTREAEKKAEKERKREMQAKKQKK